jgi:two-component sensor histidine kinase
MNGTPALNMLRFEWDESRPTPIDADGASGFGSKLIAAAVAQLDGTLTRKRGDHGLSIIIDAPIVEDTGERSIANDL